MLDRGLDAPTYVTERVGLDRGDEVRDASGELHETGPRLVEGLSRAAEALVREQCIESFRAGAVADASTDLVREPLEVLRPLVLHGRADLDLDGEVRDPDDDV